MAAAITAKATIYIPPYSTLFPRALQRQRVEQCLARWKDTVSNDRQGHDGRDSYAASELITLLSVEDDETAAVTANNDGNSFDIHQGGREIMIFKPIGFELAKPTHILNLNATSTSAVSNLEEKEFHSALLSLSQRDVDDSSISHSPLFISLSNKLTIVTPHIAQEVLLLSKELHLSNVEAVALLAEAYSRMNSEKDEIDQRYSEDLVQSLVSAGRVGFVKSEDSGDDRSLLLASLQQNQQQQQPQYFNLATTASSTNQTDQSQQYQKELLLRSSKTVQLARQIFFDERGALLMTLSNLIRHRILAIEEEIAKASNVTTTPGNERELYIGYNHNYHQPHPIIVATDQLLQSGLVINLIQTIREVNGQMKDLRENLLMNFSSKQEIECSGGAPKTMRSSENDLFRRIAEGDIGSFRALAVGNAGGLTAATEAFLTEKKFEMDFALLGFTQVQRHIASECIFYLAYHTQLTSHEVASLIDLIKDMTNGNDTLNEEGLSILDPLIKDVPSPYEAALDSSSPAFSLWQQQHYQQQQYVGVPPPLKVKDKTHWNEELIRKLWERGQAQLLQCISTLIMSVICALNSMQVLVDRERHGPNSFGKGNALLLSLKDSEIQSPSTSLGNFQSIHTRLDPNNQAVKNEWKRQDIWGFLLIPFAVLLRNATSSQLASPRDRSGGVLSPSRSSQGQLGQINVKAFYTQCLMVASQSKSITFARMSLLPSFGMPYTSSPTRNAYLIHLSDNFATFDFYATILADITAQYIDALSATGSLPITREEWYDEEFNLAQTEWMEREQRRQFGMWAGQAVKEESIVARAVNIMDRPDCLEDIFSLVSSICASNPSSANAFWKIIHQYEMKDEEDDSQSSLVVRLVPSRFLERLDLIHTENETLLFVYISFLASLALADGCSENEMASNGATMIHSFLSGEQCINPQSERHVSFRWINVINAIKWYAEQLSPLEGEDANKTDSLYRSATTVDTHESSTSYYYGVSGTNSSSNIGETSTSPDQVWRPGQPSPTGEDPKARVLDEAGKNTLISLLCLISNVVARSSTAREYILGLQFPTQSRRGTNRVYQEDSLEVMFSLLMTPLPPCIQGMTFMAIANLVQPRLTNTNIEDLSERPKYEPSRRAWELLEMCQFVPIKMLSQYSVLKASAGTNPHHSFGRSQSQGMMELSPSVFPQSTDYGMLYQLEHVEIEAGRYPATEGFMYLLTVLIKTSACPSDLGAQWRLRPGCAPYIEYVMDFVLPRATGTAKNVKPLPFSTVADKCRLINRALEVIEAVIVRYIVPHVSGDLTFEEVKTQHQSFVNISKKELGISLVSSDVLPSANDLSSDEVTDSIQDFRNIYLNSIENAANHATGDQLFEESCGDQIPLPKTPGFYVLSNLISSSEGRLLKIIRKLLSERSGPKSVHEYGEIMFQRSLAIALFRETPPDFTCAKDAADYLSLKQRNQVNALPDQNLMSSLQQSMIQSVSPIMPLSCHERGCPEGLSLGHADDALFWRERVIVLSLRILCAAIVREDAFTKSLQEKSLSIVPTLGFKGPIHGSFAHRFVEEQKVYISKLSILLTKTSVVAKKNHLPEILPIITEYVGCSAHSLKNPQEIAKNSFCILSYISQTLPQSQCINSLCGDEFNGYRLAIAFSRSLSLPWNTEKQSSNIHQAIFDLILSGIGLDTSTDLNLSLMLLGLTGSKHNCFSVILEFIADEQFVLHPRTSSSATKCFEIIFRLMQCGIPKVLSILREQHFWHTQIARYLGMRSPFIPSILHEISHDSSDSHIYDIKNSTRDNDVLHSISWLLKGLALELHSLVLAQRESSNRSHLDSNAKYNLSSKSTQLKSLFDLLLSEPNSLIQTALLDLPLRLSDDAKMKETLQNLSLDESSRYIFKKASIRLPGLSACARYEIIDIDFFSSQFRNHESSTKEAAVKWATTWNTYVTRIYASSHITQAWSDLFRTMIILFPFIECDDGMFGPDSPLSMKEVMEILCTILLRLTTPDNLYRFGQNAAQSGSERDVSDKVVKAESGMALSLAALSLTEFLFHTCKLADKFTVEHLLIDEDMIRISALFHRAISAFSYDSSVISSNDECAVVLKCALSQVLTFMEDIVPHID